MIAPRTVLPELLDELPPDSPAALTSRRDLRIINLLLGNKGWVVRVVREYWRQGEGLLEIGAGTGELARALTAVVPELAGLDINPCPPRWPATASWFETDVCRFNDWASYPVVIGNLVFHHFDRERLAQLGAKINAHCRLLVANEPLRATRTARLFNAICPLIRAHSVTRYDGAVSIAAGFRGDELARLLHLDPSRWSWQVDETWRGSCRLVAQRRS